MSYTNLINSALKARENAYAPYSRYRVGAALLDKNGHVFLGCNVENASYGATICAERSAFSSAVSQGAKGFTAIAIVGGHGDNVSDFASPCGICRQVMAELCDKDFKIILFDGKNEKVFTLNELLPQAFNLE